MLKYLMDEMRGEAGLLDEITWKSGSSSGAKTTRQEAMEAMQALLGKLPREAKQKLTKAEVSGHGAGGPIAVKPSLTVQIEGPWYGRNLSAIVTLNYVPKGQVGREHIEIGAYLDKPGGDPLGRDSDSNLFKGKPEQAQQLGTKAGTWLRGVLLKAKKGSKKNEDVKLDEAQQMSLLAPGKPLASKTDKAKGAKAERDMKALMHKAPGLTKVKPQGPWGVNGYAPNKAALKKYLGQWDGWAKKNGLKFHIVRKIMGPVLMYGYGKMYPTLHVSFREKEDGMIFVSVIGFEGGSSYSEAFSRHSSVAKKPPAAGMMRESTDLDDMLVILRESQE